MFSKLIFFTMIFSSVCFAQDREIASLRETIQKIDQTYPKPNDQMKKELLSLEGSLKSVLKTREVTNPTPEQFDSEVEARTLLLTWGPVFEMTRHRDKKKCSSEIDGLFFDGTIGMDEGAIRPDYDIAIKLLKKICS